jgi:formamidopyrimidine-DNA glycosylase
MTGTASHDRLSSAQHRRATDVTMFTARSAGHTDGVPELLEVEMYRAAASCIVGRVIDGVPIADDLFVRRTPQLAAVLVGCRVTVVRRHGKVLLIDTDGPVLGVRFGMTGLLQVDGVGPIDHLAYGPTAAAMRFERLRLDFVGGGTLSVLDARRLGSAELDPDLSALGPDAASVTIAELRTALRGTSPVKSVLLDQTRIAGLGNMLADEVLLRAGIDPVRAAGTLGKRATAALHDAIAATLVELGERGGSHTGRLSVDRRRPGATCPLDGTVLVRRRIGGRTTYSCPAHQR